MGRLLASIAIVAAAVAVLVSTSSGSVDRQARVSCHATGLTLFFWPNGHNAVPSINFPSFPYPHLEVYRSGNSYPNQNFFAGIGFGPSGQPYGGFAQSCTAVKSKIINSKPARAKTDQTKELVCTFPKAAQLEIGHPATTPVSVALRVILPSKKRTSPLAVLVSMTDQPGGSTLRYDAKYCKAYPPPQ